MNMYLRINVNTAIKKAHLQKHLSFSISTRDIQNNQSN